jgi:hypothetical protein
MKRSPNSLNDAIIAYLQLRGCTVWRNNTGAGRISRPGGRSTFIRFGYKGSGDVIGYTPGGRFVSVEGKAGSGRATPEQREFIESVSKAGGFACVAHDIDELDAAWSKWWSAKNAGGNT